MADFSGGLFPQALPFSSGDSSSSGDFAAQAAASGFYDSGAGDMSGGPGPGTGVVPSPGSDLYSQLGGALTDIFTGGAFGGGGPAAALATGLMGGAGTTGTPMIGRRMAKHLNKSTYVTRRGGLNLVPKGTKLVSNRRRNAGNAKAVRRALGRLAMFDNLARKVEGEMARVARRHHRAAPRHRTGGHKPGCKCFRCRR